ncbi:MULTISPECIES: RNA polymerase sigma factor [Dyadobacter]|jgi:RNA polymerase sigma factor (sigma-70 family)|uniref:RNA polymerase sigma factor (Sigma-70 family) n=1 Tax=Dyadobacter jiangsuensis TaxID=1591085 RepID=A0A2P8FZU7_9BACT|nr:sigma factor [Dyadobacter jiangsuensis]PSL27251.1 RNA polymerase sigma factor (sigma-70 family) [Dyadobacter jiangsuensis]HWV32679.1 sigma factor [Dyadobacter sp.]
MKEPIMQDHILAASIRNGDIPSFTRVYETYHAYLFRFALRFLKSTEHAEEAVHDVFLKLWENRDGLNNESSLKCYLLKICKSHIFHTLTRAGKEQAVLQL